MKRVLEGLKPEKVFYFFEEISRIPRGSGNEQAISDYLVNFAKERGLQVKRDDALNVVIDKPATPGYENRPKVILQGHMDMVCVKNPGVEHDFLKDPISLVIDGEFLRADGTSLGADDGNAVSLCLAILDNNEIKHPALEVVITTGEETGLKGATLFDGAMMNGNYLIGLDYSQDTNILVSCAGSSDNYFCVSAKKNLTENSERKAAFQIRIEGLTSGHSGIEIIRGRANANRLLGEILSALNKEGDCELALIHGGDKKNVIPASAEAVVLMPKAKSGVAVEIFDNVSAALKKEYRETDPGMKLLCTETGVPASCYSKETTQTVLTMLDLMPNGLQNYLNAERTLTKCSANLGMIYETDDGIELASMVRSNSEYEHDQILRRMEQLSRLTGVKFVSEGRTPVWEYDPESHFISKVQDIWQELRGVRPPVNIIHAGVETGMFIGKMKEQGKKLEAINLGVRNYDVHTPRERMEIASIGRTYELLLKILENID